MVTVRRKLRIRRGFRLGETRSVFGEGEALPVNGKLFLSGPTNVEITQFDRIQAGKRGLVVPTVGVALGEEFPGSALVREYYMTILARTAIGAAGSLVDTPPQSASDGSLVTCNVCRHVIPFQGDMHALCDACGAECDSNSVRRLEPCGICGGRALTVLAPAFDGGYCPCPFCREGQLVGMRDNLSDG
jgi:hypothetical protein